MNNYFKFALTSGFILFIYFYTISTGFAIETICYACHNIEFLEKGGRCSAWMDHAHPVYIKPSKRIEILTKNLLPLDENGNIFCGTCHHLTKLLGGDDFAEAKKNQYIYTGKLVLNVDNTNSLLCKLCHARQLDLSLKNEKQLDMENINYDIFEQESSKKSFNHPQDILIGRASRKLIESGAKYGSLSRMVICETCHAMHDTSEKKLLVMSKKEGLLCAQCHPRISLNLSRRNDFRHTHPQYVKFKKAVVSPKLVSKGAQLDEEGRLTCLTCHNIHNSRIKKGLLLMLNRNSSLCMQCHPDKLRRLEKTGHNYNISAPRAKNDNNQTVKEGGICSPCHPTHGNRKTKKLDLAGSNLDLPSLLCARCHLKEGIAKTKISGEHSHPTGVPGPDRENKTLPLYTENGSAGRKGLVTCGTCHDPHAPTPGQEIAQDLYSKPKQNFLRLGNDESELCNQCHSQKIKILKTPHDFNYTLADRSAFPKLAEGVKEKMGVCDQCHSVHNSSEVKMWNRELPKKPDKAKTITLICYSCHWRLENEAEEETNLSHPVDIDIKLLNLKKDPGLPLVNKQVGEIVSGKVTCVTCHNIHKPDRSGYFLRVLVQDNMDSLCSRCHLKKLTEIKGSKHDLTVSAPDETNINGQTAGQSGICESCHLAHNGRSAQIWAKEVREGSDVVSELCYSCHREDKAADRELIGKISHPVGVKNLPGLNNMNFPLPLFSKAGERVNTGGMVTCATCHNPHKPNPSGDIRPAEDTEENEGNFLRADYNLQKSALCDYCHRDEGRIYKTDHDLNVTAQYTFNSDGELPRDIPICRNCHSVHNAKIPFRLWNRGTGKGNDGISMLCTDCHSSGKSAAAKIITGHSHVTGERMFELQTGVYAEISEVPLYNSQYKPINNLSGDTPRRGMVLCSSCHQVHKWKGDSDSYGSGKNEEGDNSTSFLRKKNTGKSLLCLECHPRQGLIIGSKHDLSEISPEYRNQKNESLAESGICGACHQVHSAVGKDMFWSRILDKDRDNRVSQYCGGCHRKEGLAEKYPIQPKSHPIGLKIPGHLNNKLPLFLKNGERNDKDGRITCSTCHDIHKRIVNPSGGKIAIQYDFLRTNRSSPLDICENCHRGKKMMVDSPHNLSSQGEFVCSFCHKPHNARYKRSLWNYKLGPVSLPDWDKTYLRENDINIRFCTGCHRPEGLAADLLPKYGLHKPGLAFIQKIVGNIFPGFPYPVYEYLNKDKKVMITSTAVIKGMKGRFPLYSQRGALSSKGSINCSTCHDAHLFSSAQPTGKVSNYPNKFLRKEIARLFCADCHGTGSLRKYALYHENRVSRTKRPRLSGEGKTSPHWKGRVLTKNCKKCHENNQPFCNSHYVYPASSRKNNKNDSSGCLSCHNPGIQSRKDRSLKLKNPFFLNDSIIKSKSSKDGDKVDDPCYHCHAIEEFGRFNPHVNQVNRDQDTVKEKGYFNTEICLYCHYRVPDFNARKTGRYFLKYPLGTICVGCHPDKAEEHKFGPSHYGFRLTKKIFRREKKFLKKLNNIILPYKRGKRITCTTCHDPHQPEIYLKKKGGDWYENKEAYRSFMMTSKIGDKKVNKLKSFVILRLRINAEMLCFVCHDAKELSLDDLRFLE